MQRVLLKGIDAVHVKRYGYNPSGGGGQEAGKGWPGMKWPWSHGGRDAAARGGGDEELGGGGGYGDDVNAAEHEAGGNGYAGEAPWQRRRRLRQQQLEAATTTPPREGITRSPPGAGGFDSFGPDEEDGGRTGRGEVERQPQASFVSGSGGNHPPREDIAADQHVSVLDGGESTSVATGPAPAESRRERAARRAVRETDGPGPAPLSRAARAAASRAATNPNPSSPGLDGAITAGQGGWSGGGRDEKEQTVRLSPPVKEPPLMRLARTQPGSPGSPGFEGAGPAVGGGFGSFASARLGGDDGDDAPQDGRRALGPSGDPDETPDPFTSAERRM